MPAFLFLRSTFSGSGEEEKTRPFRASTRPGVRHLCSTWCEDVKGGVCADMAVRQVFDRARLQSVCCGLCTHDGAFHPSILERMGQFSWNGQLWLFLESVTKLMFVVRSQLGQNKHTGLVNDFLKSAMCVWSKTYGESSAYAVRWLTIWGTMFPSLICSPILDKLYIWCPSKLRSAHSASSPDELSDWLPVNVSSPD